MDSQLDKQSEAGHYSAKLEYAKNCLLNSKGNKEKFKKGMTMLQEACKEGNPEALFLMAKLNLDGILHPKNESGTQRGMKLMFMAANAGSLQARVMLNELCKEKYEQNFKLVQDSITEPHPLVDFEGNPIEIKRTGLFTPIDAILEFKEEKNVLTFRCNLDFINLFAARDAEKFKAAVVKGIKAWEGEYEVFGGQQLTVKLEVTTENRLLDNVHIYLMNGDGRKLMGESVQLAETLGMDKTVDYMEMLSLKENSFATLGKQWSVKSRKVIWIVLDDVDDVAYEEIVKITTHEFGHALGLGDLYQHPQKGLQGVSEGNFVELDSYSVANGVYNLVMCTHHGMISNNDIEMIVLAFSENAMQNYQPGPSSSEVSEALGKGN